MAVAVPTGGSLVVRPHGEVYTFDGAQFHGSLGQLDPTKPPGGKNSLVPVKPIVGVAPTKTGRGYWLVGSDGGVYCFGDAGFHGSAPQFPQWGIGTATNPVVGIATYMAKDNGYIIIADDGKESVPALYRCYAGQQIAGEQE